MHCSPWGLRQQHAWSQQVDHPAFHSQVSAVYCSKRQGLECRLPTRPTQAALGRKASMCVPCWGLYQYRMVLHALSNMQHDWDAGLTPHESETDMGQEVTDIIRDRSIGPPAAVA